MQASMFPTEGFGAMNSLVELTFDLWRLWNEGNTSYTTRKVNLLIESMEKVIATMVDVPKQSGKQEKFYWVNAAVDEDDLPEIERLFPSPEVTFTLLTAVLADGLKVSFNVNAKNSLTICSLSDRREESPTFGACLTGGADGWYDALCVCLYKFTALLQGDLANGSATNGPKARII